MQAKQPVMCAPVLDGGRIVNLRPTRAVTPEEIAAYWRDGVVKLEGILPVEAAAYLGDVFEDIPFASRRCGIRSDSRPRRP